MIALAIYLTLGVLCLSWVLWKDRSLRNALIEFLGMLIFVAVWPYPLLGRWYANWKRRTYNRDVAVRRQESREQNAIKHDIDGWWVGADLSENYQVRIGYRR